MAGYFIFVITILFIIYISNLISKKGFEELYFHREIDKEKVFQNEVLKVTNVIENKKILPIVFLLIREDYPIGLYRIHEKNNIGKENIYTSTYSIGIKERLKRTYSIVANDRGVYTLRSSKIVIGDMFGFSTCEKEFEDFKEIVVYPKFNSLKNVEFDNNSMQGDEIVKRWIYKDPLYIKGIREYTINDRMKDIHWNSSMKMNNLMVKDYETTSEKKVMFILNMQYAIPFWAGTENKITEKSISLVMSMSDKIIKSSVPVSISTNAYLISIYKEYENQTNPYTTNFSTILEFGARIDNNPRIEFHKHLKNLINGLDKNTVYVIVAAFLDDESFNILIKLMKMGFIIKIIDVSSKGKIPKHPNIESLRYKGGCC